MSQVLQFEDVVFEQQCANILQQLRTLEPIWRMSDLQLLHEVDAHVDEPEELTDDLMDRLQSQEKIEQGSSSMALFELLRRGIVLCSLLNTIKPNSVTKINKQTDREFLCKENVWRFLAGCKTEMGLSFEDLFSVSDCYSDEVVKQKKVLKTIKIFLAKCYEVVTPVKETKPVDQEKSKETLRREQKDNVIKELIETERNYVRDLSVMRDDIMRLEKAGALTKDQISAIYGNVKDILKFQSTFLIQLEECPKIEIGNLFKKWSKEFAVYGPYCLGHENAGAVVATLMPVLQKSNLKLEPKFELGSFLLKPVQRICKYPLLLRELAKNTDENTDEHKNILAGLEAMKGVTGFINELKKRREAMELVKQLESRIENWEEKGGDLRVYGVLKYDGLLSHVKGDGKTVDYYCFAFEKMFMYCKEASYDKKDTSYKFKGKILLSDADTLFQVLSPKVPGGHCFQLTAKGERIIFRAKNKDQLDKWTLAISACAKAEKNAV